MCKIRKGRIEKVWGRKKRTRARMDRCGRIGSFLRCLALVLSRICHCRFRVVLGGWECRGRVCGFVWTICWIVILLLFFVWVVCVWGDGKVEGRVLPQSSGISNGSNTG